MTITKLVQMFDILKSREKKRLIAVWANDSHTLRAVSAAIDKNIVEATLVGNKSEIVKTCLKENININKFQIIHAEEDIEAAAKAVYQVNEGHGHLLMKGLISTDKYMRAILNKEKGLTPPGALISHVTVLDIPAYHKLLIFSDPAVIPEPNLRQKITIIDYLLRTARSLGIEMPKLAILTASEQVLPKLQSSSDAAVISKMGRNGQIKGAIIDGPLALDLAINKKAAKIKGIHSDIAGDADCLLFPNIETANVFYKCNTNFAHAESGALVVGARVPAILSSRGDSVKTKLYSIAIGAMMAENNQV